MQEIGKISLKNSGGFATRLEFKYSKDGNVAHKKGTGNITLGCAKTADPGDYGVPDGAAVWLYAYVILGKDNEAKQQFIYKRGNTTVANYVITGTTLNNDLGLIGFSTGVCDCANVDSCCVTLTKEQKEKIMQDLNNQQ